MVAQTNFDTENTRNQSVKITILDKDGGWLDAV